MPNLDKTGPEGKGPTGMRCGGCNDSEAEKEKETSVEKDEKESKEE